MDMIKHFEQLNVFLLNKTEERLMNINPIYIPKFSGYGYPVSSNDGINYEKTHRHVCVMQEQPPKRSKVIGSKINKKPYFGAYDGGPYWCWWDEKNEQGDGWIKCPFGVVGDLLFISKNDYVLEWASPATFVVKKIKVKKMNTVKKSEINPIIKITTKKNPFCWVIDFKVNRG